RKPMTLRPLQGPWNIGGLLELCLWFQVPMKRPLRHCPVSGRARADAALPLVALDGLQSSLLVIARRRSRRGDPWGGASGRLRMGCCVGRRPPIDEPELSRGVVGAALSFVIARRPPADVAIHTDVGPAQAGPPASTGAAVWTAALPAVARSDGG